MMKSIVIYFSLCITLTVYSQANVSVSGIVKNNKGYKNVYLDDIATKTISGKDTVLPDGSFKLSATVNAASYYKLRFGYEGAGIFLIVKPKDNIRVTVDMNDMNNPVVEGSDDTKILYTLMLDLQKMDKKIEEETSRLKNERSDYLLNALRKNYGSLAVLFFTEQVPIEKDISLMTQISNELTKKYSENVFVKDFSDKVNAASFLAIGSAAPEIELPDTSGKMIKLSSLRGSYVLIEFWASWCGPCRMSNPQLLTVYNEFKNKNFKIYAVSLDKKRDSWIGAINTDKLPWIQVSDLKFWESDAAVKYRVASIPYSVLIDPKGLVLAKELRPDDLKQKLNSILNKKI